ncbi:hypothetical protein BWI96_00310 [Siphonobacter sp. SORGH_AS_0500]|nr:hypothetical protein BWI96_00310 [Siphonobacter sp. SORGH_AS_0500]
MLPAKKLAAAVQKYLPREAVLISSSLPAWPGQLFRWQHKLEIGQFITTSKKRQASSDFRQSSIT